MLDVAADAIAAFLNKALKPVLVCGVHMRSPRARAAVIALAEATGVCVGGWVDGWLGLVCGDSSW